MKIRLRIALAIIAAIACMASDAAANQKTASPMTWNPTCGTIRFRNLTALTAQVTLVTVPAGAIPPVTVAGGTSSAAYPTIGSPFLIYDVMSMNPSPYPLLSPAGSPPGGVPGTASRSVECVTLPPTGNCFDLWFDLGTCTCYIVYATCGTCRP
jgi:hypothetical protein